MSYFYDVVASFLIFFIFGLIFIGLVVAAMAKNIEKNWPKYKCNPIVIPLAGFVGKDTVKNFTECIGDIQGGFMSFFLQPMKYAMSVLSDVGGQVINSLNHFRNIIEGMLLSVLGFFGDFLGVFKNITIVFQLMMGNIKDLLLKIVGVIYTIGLLIQSTTITIQSLINSTPGQLIVELSCFPGNTKIKLEDGSFKEMSKLNLGDTLTTGGKVHAILRIQGNKNNPYYKIYSEELKTNIYVTAEHLIKNTSGDFIKVKNHEKAVKTDKWDQEMSCLVTTDNLIPIGEHIFWDWED